MSPVLKRHLLLSSRISTPQGWHTGITVVIIPITKRTLKILLPTLRTAPTRQLQPMVPGLRPALAVLIVRLRWHHCSVPIKLLFLPAHRRPARELALSVKQTGTYFGNSLQTSVSEPQNSTHLA